MHNRIWNKRLPTAVGMILVVISVIATSLLVRAGFRDLIHASSQPDPQNVLVTNISQTSFTVTYTTLDPVTGTISYGSDNSFTSVGLDDRDHTDSVPKPYTVHHITVTNLHPKTNYRFQIVSGGQTFSDKGNPYTITTASLITNQASNPVMRGKVTTPDGSPIQAIAYVSSNASETLSSVVKADGSYSIPLKNLLTTDLTQSVSLTDTVLLQVRIVSNAQSSSAQVLTLNATNVPLITLSQNYDFSQKTPTAFDLEGGSGSESASFPGITGTPQAAEGPRIISPANNSSTNDAQPVFKGTGEPNTKVDIVIHSDQAIQAQVLTDANGNWTYRPTTKLSPGKHTITITTKDALGVLVPLSQSFTVLAAGSQFIEPSVSPIQPTETLTPTQAPSTPTPTTALRPTATPTIALTATPLPTATVVPGPTATPAPLEKMKTGSNSVVSGIIASISTILVGAIIFFLTRGTISL